MTKKERKIFKKKERNNYAGRGGLGMGFIFSIIYALSAVVGMGVIAIFGKAVDMPPIYGILIPFGFSQGPGQASTYGRIFEQNYGYVNAEMVSLSFAAFGFLFAYIIGVPLAKYGLKKGYAAKHSVINRAIEKGFYSEEEQRQSIGKETTYSGSLSVLSYHIMIMSVTYLLAVLIAKLIAFIPGFGSIMAAMLFFWGMLAAYIMKGFLRLVKMDHLLDNSLQSHITGFASDFLVVGSFMAVQLSVVGQWIFPIVIACIVIALMTLIITYFFGARLGSNHDFERILGMYGTSTGTTASGISLIRIIDPKLQSGAGAELGVMNLAMLLTAPSLTFITMYGEGSISTGVLVIGSLIAVVFYLIMLLVMGLVKKKKFSAIDSDTDRGFEPIRLQGFLIDDSYNVQGIIQ